MPFDPQTFIPEHQRRPDSPLKERITDALKTIYDPEIPVNVFDLGLVYDIDIDAENHVTLTVTLTSPNCPEAETLPGDMEKVVRSVEGVSGTTLNLVWEPPFTMDMLSEAAKLELNLE